MRPTVRLMAYPDDIYFASKPEQVGDVVAASIQELWAHARIRVRGGETHIWNRAGTKPQVCDILQRQAEEILKQGSGEGPKSPPQNRGSKCWGTPLGSRRLCQPTFGTDPAEAQKTLEQNPHTSRRPISMASLAPLRLNESELLVEGGQT